jgi:hypothetical protein
MTGWIILGVVALLILLTVILLFCSVVAVIEYDGDFRARAKYAGFTLFDSKNLDSPEGKPKKAAKSEKQRKKLKKAKKTGTAIAKEKKQSFAKQIMEKSGLDEIVEDVKKANKRSFDFELYKLIYDSMKSPVKHLVSKVRITHLRLVCVVATGDAMKTALLYGAQSAAISGGLAWVSSVMTLKAKEVKVTADFAKEKTEITMKCKVKIRVITAVVCGFKVLKASGINLKTVMNLMKQ